jgi:hypothetical protein
MGAPKGLVVATPSSAAVQFVKMRPGVRTRPRSAQEIHGVLVSALTRDGHHARARALFGRDAAAPTAGPASTPAPALAPGGRTVPTPSGGHSFVPAPALPAVSAPARGFSGAADARPSPMGSVSIGNAAWSRSGGRTAY